MKLDKSLTAKLSRMTHSYCANASSVSTLDERGEDTEVCKRKKTTQTGCMWILLITASGFNGRYPSSKKMEKNYVNYIILIKTFAGRNDIENENNATFYNETDTLMHGFEIHS